jgi:N-acyl-L-homoserine lactone synthetase
VLEAAPYRVDQVTDPKELEAVFRLRYEVAVEEGWAEPEQMPGGLERDEYDDDAVQVAAWDGDRLAAAQRLVFPRDDRRLPTEEAFDLTVEPAGSALDVGRTAIAPAYRGEATHLLLMALQCRSWLIWRSRGFHTCIGVQTEPITQIYREMGIEFEVLAPAREYWNERRFPIRLNAALSAERLGGVWNDLVEGSRRRGGGRGE